MEIETIPLFVFVFHACCSVSTPTWGVWYTALLWLLAGRRSGSLPGTSFRTPTTHQTKIGCGEPSPAPQRSGCSAGERLDLGPEWTENSDKGSYEIGAKPCLTAFVVAQIPGVRFGRSGAPSGGGPRHHWLCSQECGRARTSLELHKSALDGHQVQASCHLQLVVFVFHCAPVFVDLVALNVFMALGSQPTHSKQ